MRPCNPPRTDPIPPAVHEEVHRLRRAIDELELLFNFPPARRPTDLLLARLVVTLDRCTRRLERAVLAAEDACASAGRPVVTPRGRSYDDLIS